MGKVCKKLISVILTFALLIESNVTVFGQLITEDKLYQPMVQEVRDLLSEGMKSELANTVSGQ
ncbi:MAG: hypothetical protein J5594_06300, partial [Elusimicrobiaceae bacterium]|nr:hypothetical protein [Elusimicrobiaceae bacterium]